MIVIRYMLISFLYRFLSLEGTSLNLHVGIQETTSERKMRFQEVRRKHACMCIQLVYPV